MDVGWSIEQVREQVRREIGEQQKELHRVVDTGYTVDRIFE